MDEHYNEISKQAGGGSAKAVPATRLTAHSERLCDIENGLERALLQYENLLNRLRGHLVEVLDKAQNTSTLTTTSEPPILERIENSTDDIQTLANKLNSAADELNGIA